MVPRILIDSAPVPGGGELRLIQRGADFTIFAGTLELMTSRQSGSEIVLATESCRRIADRADARVLIGGLGMGFTLGAALGALGPAARVTVAELVPGVVEWGRGPLAHIIGGSLDDPRVTVFTGDVGVPIRTRSAAWDAILLDVDNGPDGLTREGNNALYNLRGLHAAHAALTSGGVLAVWSSYPSAPFVNRLREVGFAVDEQVARANGRRGARHVLWFATKR